MLSQEIMELLPANMNITQLSSDAIGIMHKVYLSEALSEQENETLLNAAESAAILSVKYRRPVNHRYVKEIARDVTNKKTGTVTPARLSYDKIAGRSYLYKTKKILGVKLRRDMQKLS